MATTSAQAQAKTAVPDKIRITNHTTHEITLPPIRRPKVGPDGQPEIDQETKRPIYETEFPELRLAPGSWDVPGPYLARLMQSDRPGHRRMRGLYFEPRDGAPPMIEVPNDQSKVGTREGPAAPKTLAEYGEDAAAQFASEEDDLNALKRWQHDKRPSVAKAARDRLRVLEAAR